MKFSQHRLDQTRRIYSSIDGEVHVRDGTPISRPTPTPDAVNPQALATLLYAGTVFPPDTLFRNFYAIGPGGTLSVDGAEPDYDEPSDLFKEDIGQPEPFDPITCLAESMDASDVDLSQCKLLLSEGKDSTGIAIALAELGVKVDCVTFANSDSNVDMVTDVAHRFGHRLEVVRYDDLKIPDDHLQTLSQVFEPTVDQAFLSYLLLPASVFQGSVIIDGMGNDFYMGHLPTKDQFKATNWCAVANRIVPRGLRDRIKRRLFPNRDYCGIPLRTFSECQGLYNGFDRGVLRNEIAEPRSLDELDRRWQEFGFQKGRALSRGRYLDTYSFCGKSIALAEMAGAKIFFPWADPKIAERFEGLPPESKYQWPTVNKLPLREAINKRFHYEQAKVGFRAPIDGILDSNRQSFDQAVKASKLIPERLKREVYHPSPYKNRSVACLLVALWEKYSGAA
ncbi:hypothetical protein Mal15_36870 [Stieleria maiorica]|uniref:Asparagine synthase n=1 Tax=Stieleria maiorica TaxID=2795974 RepID=A0A5B9MEB4_9BACT|nr:hypothetical protein [Stieleria maiorica]QEF99621.1 hypothetical protein Mal15_36870 [Stieleria maiorica]